MASKAFPRDMLRFVFPECDEGDGGRPFASKGMLFVSAAHCRYPFGQVICLPERVDGYANRHDHRASSLGWDGGIDDRIAEEQGGLTLSIYG